MAITAFPRSAAHGGVDPRKGAWTCVPSRRWQIWSSQRRISLTLAMHFLLFYDVTDDYVERRAPFRAEHLSLIQKAHDRGELVMAGALADPADGAVLVFRGPSSGHAEAFAKA